MKKSKKKVKRTVFKLGHIKYENNAKSHRSNGPEYILTNGYEEWCWTKGFRKNGPNIISTDGSKI